MKRLLLFLAVLAYAVGADAQDHAKRRAVRQTPATSFDLIRSAVQSGRLDDETALVYRVFAMFNDCRLPQQYRGDDSEVRRTSILDELAARFDSLSPATQSKLLPFLLEPYATGGWVEAQQNACGNGRNVSDLLTSTITVLGGKVRVIYRTTVASDKAAAQNIAAALESKIYPTLTRIMGEPLPYDPNGADPTRLSVSLVSLPDDDGVAEFFQQPPRVSCNHGPGFVEVSPSAPHLLSAVAHEVMHVLQFAYPVATTCTYPEYQWIQEATATWAEDYVYPFENDEHDYASAFLSRPDLPLESNTGDTDLHRYGAYLLPFYIHRRFMDEYFVPRIWKAAGSMLSLAAVDNALGPHGGFKEQWPEFVLRNWNQRPFDDYRIEDQMIVPATVTIDNLNPHPDYKGDMFSYTAEGGLAPLSIAPLASQYFHYSVDDSARTVVFLNGVYFKLGIRPWSVTPSWGNTFILDNASKPRDGLKIQAMLKINGTWEQNPRDWTQRPFVAFCREFPAEHVDEVVVMVSNSEYKRRDPIATEGELAGMWASNMSCGAWKTEETTSVYKDPPVNLRWEATFKRANDLSNLDPMPILPLDGLPVLYYLYTATGTVSWDFVGAPGPCTYSGNGSFPLDMGQLTTWNFSPPQAIMHRGYTAVFKVSSEQRIHYTRVCSNTSDSHDLIVPGWSVSPPDDIRHVSNDGTSIHDQNAKDFNGKSDWALKAIPP